MSVADRPKIALTMGDVAGVGPEVIVRAWDDPELHQLTRPLVIGSSLVLEKALTCFGISAEIQPITSPEQARPSARTIPCLDVPTSDLSSIAPGRVDARAGRAAHDFLIAAIDHALAGNVDAIVTLPLNKEALRAAGVAHPGHTEILAERCRVRDVAMMLYLGPPSVASPAGLGVVHTTLHVPLRRVFDLLTIGRIQATIALTERAMRWLTEGRPPRIGVAGLNPHAGEHGLFGTEEECIIAPAIALAQSEGVEVFGPEPADTLFHRALAGDYDAVVAMYHDQGHVALKTVGFDRAVNITLGLPIVRTSVAHGTAFDIAWQGRSQTTGLLESIRVASRISRARKHTGKTP